MASSLAELCAGREFGEFLAVTPVTREVGLGL